MAKYNCQTLPAELRSKQNAKWTAHGALAELVDNSFGPARGNANEVIISLDPRAHILEVLDDGQGMDHIGRLCQGGNSIGRAVGDIGEYGAGGSLAVLWLASRVEIWTLRKAKVMFDSVTWQEWFEAANFENLGVSDDWVQARPANTPSELLALGHGTLIRLHVPKKRRLDSAKCRHELARLYSPGLRRGKKIIWRTMRRHEEIDRYSLTDAFTAPSRQAETVSFDLVVEHDDGARLTVKGQAFYDEKTTQADSRLHIGFGYRIVRSVTECFRSADGEDKYSGVGVSGWLDLGDAWRDKLTTTKDDIDDAPLFESLMAYVFEKIKLLLKKSEERMFQLEFEDLAIGLQEALQRGGGNITVLREAKAFPELEGGSAGDLKEEGPDKAPRDEPPGPREHKVPPKLMLNLTPLSDVQMNGHLCRSEVSGDQLDVFINKDHVLIVEAMRAKPVNKMLMNAVVIGEVAGTLATEGNIDFVNRLFQPQAATAITAIDDPRDRERTLNRELIDRVRMPMPSGEEHHVAA